VTERLLGEREVTDRRASYPLGHANMSTTQGYLHPAGVVFPDEAARLEERVGAGKPGEVGFAHGASVVTGVVPHP
jgi:hypothetical protein